MGKKEKNPMGKTPPATNQQPENMEGLSPRKLKGTDRELTVRIVKYVGEGVSLAYEDEKVIFVRFGIPGELMKVKVYKESKDYAMAEPVEILEKSERRLEPPCPYFSMCGGCDYQMISYEDQLALKSEWVLETLNRIGKLGIEKLSGIISSPQEYYYRNTTTFKVNPRKQLTGFFRRDSKFVVDIEECRIAMPGINQALQSMRTQEQYPGHNYKVRTTLDGDTTVHWVHSDKYEDRPVYETVRAAGREIKFKISKDSFFQVNDYVVPLWLEKIVSFLDKDGHEKIYDLFSGIGLITLFVSHFAGETIGVELAKSSVQDARHNLQINKISSNVRFELGDVFEVLPRLGPADVIIVDPPRRGLDREVVQLLLDMAPRKIIYSSCKVSTLARDIQLLSEKYSLKECYLVDMFPQTHHVEMLTLLERK